MKLLHHLSNVVSTLFARNDQEAARELGLLVSESLQSGELDRIATVLREFVTAIRYGKDGSAGNVYVASTRFLQEAHWRLVEGMEGQFKESFFYVGGFCATRAPNAHYVWDHLIPVEFAEQSAVGVLADTTSSSAALQALYEMGLTLVGHVHSHPGFGPQANYPSATDTTLVRNLASGKSVALGAIFSRSHDDREAFVRFYGGEAISPFRFVVQGTGAKQRDDNLYRLDI